MQANELRKGSKIEFRGDLYVVTDFRHYTPGNKRGFVQATLKSLTSGKLLQNKFSSDEHIERAVLDPKPCQFLYRDDQGFHFMEMDSYQSFTLGPDVVGDMQYYLKENMEIKIDFHDGKPVVPELPKVVVLKVTDSPPWVKGDSVSNNMKPVVCETGLKIQVPIFIEQDTEIKVNTDTGEYAGRA